MMVSAGDERCVVGERQWWRQMRGSDSVAAASRRVRQCDGGVTLMAADERGAVTLDEADERRRW